MSRKCDCIEGQITFEEYIKNKRKRFPGCDDCICKSCLYWWSSRCPYGKCYDDYRAAAEPYDKVHMEEPPRTGWNHWETQQAYWCRGGEFYPASCCGHFIKYKGCQVKDCLEAPVSVFQDGYIQCDMERIRGCRWCYERLEERISGKMCDCFIV